MVKMTRQKKIDFILSCRFDEIGDNKDFFNYLKNEYKLTNDIELDIEFSFYKQQWKTGE